MARQAGAWTTVPRCSTGAGPSRDLQDYTGPPRMPQAARRQRGGKPSAGVGPRPPRSTRPDSAPAHPGSWERGCRPRASSGRGNRTAIPARRAGPERLAPRFPRMRSNPRLGRSSSARRPRHSRGRVPARARTPPTVRRRRAARSGGTRVESARWAWVLSGPLYILAGSAGVFGPFCPMGSACSACAACYGGSPRGAGCHIVRGEPASAARFRASRLPMSLL